eukprot:INCI7167.2.p1 GENE.INCI7167.2~~INCI7167.2.p1  ORF type:complete len:422 (-),score=53.87 INCI7167.2:79-1344(-)
MFFGRSPATTNLRRIGNMSLAKWTLMLCLIAAGNEQVTAEQAFLIWSPPDGINATVTVLDTTAPSVNATIVLPTVVQQTLGSVLNMGTRVLVSLYDSIHEIDTTTLAVTLSIRIPGTLRLDKILLDPDNSTRLIILDPFEGLWEMNLATGVHSQLVDVPATGFDIRPGRRELFVTTTTERKLNVYDLGSGASLRSHDVNQYGIWNVNFQDSGRLLMHGYGIGIYDVTNNNVTAVCETDDQDAGWGYDWMITSDGRIVQPGWPTSRVRNATTCDQIAFGVPDTNFYYGSAADGADGTYVISGGDSDTDNSMGTGKVRVGQQDANFSFTQEFDLGDGNVIARGYPYFCRFLPASAAIPEVETTATPASAVTTHSMPTVEASTRPEISTEPTTLPQVLNHASNLGTSTLSCFSWLLCILLQFHR